MGLIKGCAKLVGTALLTATGVASTVLKGMCDTVGVDVGSEIFGATKDASFGGIRNMWDAAPPQIEEYATDKEAEEAMRSEEIRKLKVQAYRCKDLAKKATDKDVQEKFMDRYNALMEEANYLEREF